MGYTSSVCALALFVLVPIYLAGLIIYRLWFHPLAKFPGPPWSRISSFPAFYHTLRGDRHIWFWRLQQIYGPTFRYTPDSILINTPTAYRTIFGPKADIGKGIYYKAYPRSVNAITTWNAIDKRTHARKRHVLNHAFSDKALRNAEPFVRGNTDRWCQLLGEEIGNAEWSRALNMADWSNNLVFDILGDLCFGKSFGMKEPDSKLRYVPQMMIDFLLVIHPIAFSPFVKLWVWLKPRGLDTLLAKTAPPALSNWERFVETYFLERAALEEQLVYSEKPATEARKDFFHYLFSAIDPATGKPWYSKDELLGESESLIIAGADTTATTMASVFFYLARYPEAQEKLADEVRQLFGNLDDIKAGPALHQCKYLRGFIQECLRMSPPVPADLNREVLQSGITVDGQFLPPGVNVSCAAYCLHLNPDLYPDPFSFRPERWVVDEADSTGYSKEQVLQAENAFFAFSFGPRGCVGKNLAYMEMSIMLAKAVHQFEIRQDAVLQVGGGRPEFVEGRRETGQYQLHDIFVAVRDGPMINVKRRHNTQHVA